MGLIDLHMHTCFSDGLLRPAQVVRDVMGQGCIEHFAITDHDSLSGLEPALRALDAAGPSAPRLIPGVELSTRLNERNLSVHVLGYFPRIKLWDLTDELLRIEEVLGPYCRMRCKKRLDFDVIPRVKRMFELNLEGVRGHYCSAVHFMERFKSLAGKDHRFVWEQCGKSGDVFQHPIPTTYLDLINLWEDLMPCSSRERFNLYVLRPDSQRRERLAQFIAALEEMNLGDAKEKARELQGALCVVSSHGQDFLTPAQGVELLHEAGAVTFLAHPAVDHHKVGYDDYDAEVLRPLFQSGLDGIELYYPYDPSYRDEAIKHYGLLAEKHGMLTCGGSDYHGDGRTALAELRTSSNQISLLKDHNS